MHNKKRSLAVSMFKTMAVAALMATGISAFAQDNNAPRKTPRAESFGNTLNLGLGVAYYGYLGGDAPIFFANYEFNVARNFTLAPFIGIASFRSYDDYYYGNAYYYYHETIIPIGVKGTYYFDELLNLNKKWDIYAAASLGFVYDHITWDDGYNGDHGRAHSASPLYLDLHAGAEYHFNKRLGIFLDLSTGVSTLGLAIHHR